MPMKADISAPGPGRIPSKIPATIPGAPAFGFPVRLIGEAALRTLERSGAGEALAVFRRSFYLRMDAGLVCLGPPSIGTGPLNAICAFPENVDWAASGMRQGGRVGKRGDQIFVDARFGFSFAGAEAWRPASPAPGWSGEEMAAGLSRLADEAERRAPRAGLGRLIPEIVRERRSGGGGDDAFLQLARSGVDALTGWLRAALNEAGGDIPNPPEGAEALIGLGPGLTPSGDDFIGGSMIALRALEREAAAERLAGWAEPLARERTGVISRAHLACAAGGEGAGALHETLTAICRPAGADLAASVDAAGAIGHTSGWDALAGVAVVCSILRPG